MLKTVYRDNPCPMCGSHEFIDCYYRVRCAHCATIVEERHIMDEAVETFEKENEDDES